MPFTLLSSLRTLTASAAFSKSAAVDGSKFSERACVPLPVASLVPSPEERLAALLLSPSKVNSRSASHRAQDILPYLNMEGNEVYSHSHSKNGQRSVIVSPFLLHHLTEADLSVLKRYCLSPGESVNLDGAPVYRDNVSLCCRLLFFA